MDDHGEKGTQPAASIDHGRFLQLPGDRIEKRAGIPDGEGKRKGAVHHDQPHIAVDELHLLHDDIKWNTKQDSRKHPCHQYSHFKFFRPDDVISGQAVCGHHGQDHADHRSHNRDKDTVHKIPHKIRLEQHLAEIFQSDVGGNDLIGIINLFRTFQCGQYDIDKRHDRKKNHDPYKNIGNGETDSFPLFF